MFKSSLPDSLPKPASCLKVGVLPDYFQRTDVSFLIGSGEEVKTCHIVADGRRFNFREAFDTQREWGYIYFKQLSYTDEAGQTQIVNVTPRNPHIIEKGEANTVCGYVTKINGKRWGVTVHLNWRTGDTQIMADEGSPIIGVLFQLIE